MKEHYIIGISGGSASGKTFLLNQLCKYFEPEKITIISQDNYYKKLEAQVKNEAGEVNFDHPDSVDLEKFAHDISRLIRNETVILEEYTFNNPDKKPEIITYKPSKILIVEGLFVFHDQRIASLLDLKVFVDADEHIKLSRRIRRDYEERGYGLDEVLGMYESYVIPMYKQYVAPYKFDCDLILHNNKHMNNAIQVLIDHLDCVLKRLE